MRQIRTVALGLLLSLSACAAVADALKVRTDHPEVYVVKKGDTLWHISELFLATPWLWPQLWQANPQVDNPHLIYPGDHLYLTFVDGKPQLVKKPLVKLSPHIRPQAHDSAVPVLPYAVLKPFLEREQIVSEEEFEALPYVLGNNDGNKHSYEGQRIYAKGSISQGGYYGVYQPEKPLFRQGDGATAGIRMSLVATVRAVPQGEFIVMEVEQGRREIRQGNRVMPLSSAENMTLQFIPMPPELPVQGQIIASHNNVRYLGSNDVVILDRGRLDGLRPGHTLAVFEPGMKVIDDDEHPVYLEDADVLSAAAATLGWDRIALPPHSHGYVMVFRTFDSFSYALIMKADQQMRLLDEVQSLQ